MYYWLESEILAMSAGDYLAILTVMTGLFAYLVYRCVVAFKRFRFVDGTATSKIRSAAQGHVELKGLGEWLKGDNITSPFSNSRCIWYHCTIEKRQKRGKRSNWTNISDECSSHLFRLIDDTGWCIIDPDHAHVIPETDITWYGHNTEYRSQAPQKKQWLHFSMGNYRFRERLIRPATTLYALGQFSSLQNNPGDEFISRQVEDLVKQWKLQPQRYLAKYDVDNNGTIQNKEWKAIRAAARKQILSAVNKQESEHHILSRPKHSGRPYILSVIQEENLVAQKRFNAYASMVSAFALFVGVVMLTSMRPPFPV